MRPGGGAAVLGLLAGVASCSRQSDQLEVSVTFGAIDRHKVGEVAVFVDAPRGFDVAPGGVQMPVPGLVYEYVPATVGSRLVVRFTPTPGSTILADRLVFTADLSGPVGEAGTATAIAYDRLGQAVALKERGDIELAGFGEVGLALDCVTVDCKPLPGAGGYPLTYVASLPGSAPLVVEAEQALVLAHGEGMEPGKEVWAFGMPDADGGKGRVVVLSSSASFAAGGSLGGLPDACVITGDAVGDRLGAGLAVFPNDTLGGTQPGALAIGAPGANGGRGAVFVVPAQSGCGEVPVSGLGMVVRLDAPATERNLGSSLAKGRFGPLVIGAEGEAGEFATLWFVRSVEVASPATLAPDPTGLQASRLELDRPDLIGPMAIAVPRTSYTAVAVGFPAASVVVLIDPPAGGVDESLQTAPESSIYMLPATGLGTSITFTQPAGVPVAQLAIGAPAATDPAGNATGAVFVVDATVGASMPVDDCSLGLCLYGVDDGDLFGTTVAVGGFRGGENLVIGAPGARRPDDGAQAGAVYVIDAPIGEHRVLDWHVVAHGREGELLYRIFGDGGGAALGTHAVASLTDGDNGFLVGGWEYLVAWEDFQRDWGPQP